MFEHISDPELRGALRRFLREIDNYSNTEICWNWTGRKTNGYGRFYFRYKHWRAHRFSYWLEYGKLTPRLEIDHRCSNKACVNPHHLEEVDHPTNNLRGWHNGHLTHCKRGHLFDEANTYYGVGATGRPHRTCRICHNLTNKASRR